MAKHLVKCKYCNQHFDANVEPYVLLSNGRRYAHKSCAEEYEKNISQEEKDKEALSQYIATLFNGSCDYARINKQIKEYINKYNYTYSGILKTLIYWYEVKGNSIEKANGGLGIVPYVYNTACQYYYNIYLAQLANQDKGIKDYHVKVKEIEIPPPQPYMPKIKLFNLDEEEDYNV
jgi:hypothetical protein